MESTFPSQINPMQDSDLQNETREPGYPVYTLDEALKVAKAVYDLGGSRSRVTKEMLAKHLDYAETGPSFVQRLAAARCFGLIEGRGAYGLTQTGRQYFLPASETEKDNAALMALQHPPPFGALVTRFHGQKLPPNNILGNILHTEGKIPTSYKDRLASIFIKSAAAIKAIDAAGNLRAASAAAEVPETEKQNPPQSPAPRNDAPRFPAGACPHTLFLANGREINMVAPPDITEAEIKRIQKWVEVTLLVDWGNEDTKPKLT
jgi:hypothetical protein